MRYAREAGKVASNRRTVKGWSPNARRSHGYGRLGRAMISGFVGNHKYDILTVTHVCQPRDHGHGFADDGHLVRHG
ncbi:MAG TPA: hypothetical protein VGB42_10555, partial [Candidatus Thermoplasmatota archaeon]